MVKSQQITVSNGHLVLLLEVAAEGGYIVTSPFEPELITEAESLEDAFAMAKDAIKALHASRTKLQSNRGSCHG